MGRKDFYSNLWNELGNLGNFKHGKHYGNCFRDLKNNEDYVIIEKLQSESQDKQFLTHTPCSCPYAQFDCSYFLMSTICTVKFS